MLVDLLRY